MKVVAKSELFLDSITAALALGLFILDLQLPLGAAVGVLYSLVVLVSFWSSRRGLPLAVASACTALTIIGAFFGPVLPAIPVWMVVSNRLFSLLVIWVPALFLYQHRRADDQLRQAYGELENLVQERTKELSEVNKALVAEITERIETEQSLRTSEAALQASQHALQQNKEELRALAARLMTAQEEERRRLSRDLHDDINQRLAMLAIEMGTLAKRASSSPELLQKGMTAIREQLAVLSDDIRHMAYQCHPSILDDLGLPTALKRLAHDFSARTGVRSSFADHDLSEPLPQDIASCLYRIAQESLSNAARHAKASEVVVKLVCDEETATLLIRDNGVGFDPLLVNTSRGGLGLVNIKERVRLVRGQLVVQSAPGQGTSIRVQVPLPVREP